MEGPLLHPAGLHTPPHPRAYRPEIHSGFCGEPSGPALPLGEGAEQEAATSGSRVGARQLPALEAGICAPWVARGSLVLAGVRPQTASQGDWVSPGGRGTWKGPEVESLCLERGAWGRNETPVGSTGTQLYSHRIKPAPPSVWPTVLPLEGPSVEPPLPSSCIYLTPRLFLNIWDQKNSVISYTERPPVGARPTAGAGDTAGDRQVLAFEELRVQEGRQALTTARTIT